MDNVFLFPRLPLLAARSRFHEVVGKEASQLIRSAESSHPEMIFAATGGTRVDESVLKALRDRILAAARELGFPNSGRQEKQLAFDPEAGRVLFESLPILPGEASRDDFWSFLSLVLLPDIATWRFPDQNDRRFLGGVRNVFQRLWWRAYLLRDIQNDDPWWLLRLPEDALVGLMERPGISSNPVVTRTIARGIAEVAKLPADVREDAWREAFKRIRQRFPIVNVDALPHDELERQIKEICDLTTKARVRTS